MFYGFDQVFNILFAIIFFCVLGTMVYIFVKNISTWNKNNNSPRLTVAAKIVAKRTKVSIISSLMVSAPLHQPVTM